MSIPAKAAVNKVTFFILLILLLSCGGNKREETIARLVTEWTGKEIQFPDSVVFTRYAKDTVDYRIPQAGYKVLVYVDSVGCAQCKLKLPEWKEFMAHTDSVTGGNVPFLFFIYPHNPDEMYYLMDMEGFDHPACIDLEDRLNRLNRFSTDTRLQAFLLDEDNKVVIVGNPVLSMGVWELYLNTLKKLKAAS